MRKTVVSEQLKNFHSDIASVGKFQTNTTSGRLHQQIELVCKKGQNTDIERAVAFQNCLKEIAQLQINEKCLEALITLAD